MSRTWENLSLRARLFLPMLAMILAALVLGGIALKIVSPDQFEYETGQQAAATQAVAAALNAALATSGEPQRTLAAFSSALGSGKTIAFRSVGHSSDRPAMIVPSHVPRWFIALLDIPELGAVYPISIGKDHVGDLLFTPDLSADIFEKYVGFLAIVGSGSALMLIAALSVYFTTGTALRPLERLQEGLTRMRQGDYDTLTPVAGPPEIRRSCKEANQLASTLKRLSLDNRGLIRKLVSVQDDERHDLGQELHDELGPLLFAIRANATALSDRVADDPEAASAVHGILQAAENLQQVSRRILEGLSPLHVKELGLEQSIRALLGNVQAQAPRLKLSCRIDASLNEIDGLLSLTTYRVIQESVTNVLRHAHAGAIDVAAEITGAEVAIEVADDGEGFPPDSPFGRGLRGMDERVRALNGSFALLRDGGRTVVRCRLPLAQEAA
ncbi:Two-component sensor histidine kinase [Bradyrhizobium sp. STM 3843]|uniref:histidine kinase n=1 Tax=Bradyrhizobium sp. STM 3843 TaxID=551947 RepID=UPI0002407C81|nr:histidine kinase [Bradyrhizobium sp. STM 3843]CCE04900.1 Two-component sensor histidine kinase [Bradyrhizobium sp. STM 3843]